MTRLFIRGYRGAGFGGRFIMRFTFGGFSHVSLVFKHTDLPATEIQSIQGRGVYEEDFIDKPDTVLYAVPCNTDQFNEAYELAKSLCGCKYDWAGIFGFMLRKKKENPDKWFCSELVAYVLLKVGIILQRLPPWKQSPVIVCASPTTTIVDGIHSAI